MKHKILIILIILSGLIKAQTSFEKIYSEYNSQGANDITVCDEGNYYTTGSLDSNQYSIYVLKIDSAGNYINSKCFIYSNPSIGYNIKYFNNFIYIIGIEENFQSPPPYKSKMIFLKLDKDLNIIENKLLNITDNRLMSFSKFKIDSDSSIIIVGSIAETDLQNYFIQKPFIYKISLLGDSLIYKPFPTNSSGRINDILEKKDSTGYIALIDNYTQSFVFSTDKFLYLNKGLDSLYIKPIPNNITQNFSSEYLNDTTLIISGIEQGYYEDLRVQTVNINDSGNNYIDFSSYSNNNYYYSSSHSNGLSINNSNIYLGGYKKPNYYTNITDTTWFYLIKLNTNLTPIWEKYIGGNAHYKSQSILATNDGGCIMVGTRHDHTVQTYDEVDIYVVKVASDGTIMWEKEININPKINIFPNPGTDIININSDTDYSNFYLYDMFGKIVISENTKAKTINTSRLQNSIYIYRITNTQGEVLKTGKWVKQ